MNTLSERIKFIRQQQRWTQQDMAAICGLTNSSVSSWEGGRGGISTDNAATLARSTGYNTEWIKTGAGPKRGGNTEPYQFTERTIPMLSESQAAQYGRATEGGAEPEYQCWVTPAAPVSANAFALRVNNDSMTNPSGFPSFPEGIVLIIDPQICPVHKSYVVVQEGEGVLFRQLIIEGERRHLVALNPRWANIALAADAHIIGKVVAAQFVL